MLRGTSLFVLIYDADERLIMESDDAVKCAESLQKYIELRRESGTRLQV
jgi:hypothetical protein